MPVSLLSMRQSSSTFFDNSTIQKHIVAFWAINLLHNMFLNLKIIMINKDHGSQKKLVICNVYTMPCYYYVPIVYGLGQHFCNQQTKTSNNMPYIRAYSNLIEMSDITIILQQCCYARTSNPFKKKGMVMVLVTQQQILLRLFFMTVRELRNSKRSDLCHCEVKRHDFLHVLS